MYLAKRSDKVSPNIHRGKSITSWVRSWVQSCLEEIANRTSVYSLAARGLLFASFLQGLSCQLQKVNEEVRSKYIKVHLSDLNFILTSITGWVNLCKELYFSEDSVRLTVISYKHEFFSLGLGSSQGGEGIVKVYMGVAVFYTQIYGMRNDCLHLASCSRNGTSTSVCATENYMTSKCAH